MRNFDRETVTAVQSRVQQVVNDVAPVTSFEKSEGAGPASQNDTTSNLVSLDIMAERVYANLSRDGDIVNFRVFLSTLRKELRLRVGKNGRILSTTHHVECIQSWLHSTLRRLM